ncbi:MAG: hypothetical protein KDN20_17730, partial [Verrucomicrobiae bacterium]|nr:hypothetical protein [Verrucomicrobiae bacterium]
ALREQVQAGGRSGLQLAKINVKYGKTATYQADLNRRSHLCKMENRGELLLDHRARNRQVGMKAWGTFSNSPFRCDETSQVGG